jgi:geranylgeranyl diphosphate synthase type II
MSSKNEFQADEIQTDKGWTNGHPAEAVSIDDFQKQMNQKVQDIEQILQKYLPEANGYQSIIMDAMEYNLMAGGKRLRPMLMKETYRLYGGTSQTIEPFMAALEMIHTYSLIHDDLPAMDNDDYRRGRKTTHLVYGEDMAILAGDALLNYAFETACEAFTLVPEDSLRIGRALQILGKKSGIYGMVGGQVIDVKETGHAIEKEVLDTIYALKTGALIEAAMMIGAVLAGAPETEIPMVEQIAASVGLAFQIQDDILDVTSTAEVLGKPIHSDEKNNKTTYVTLEGLEESGRMVEELSASAIDLLHQLSGENSYLEQLLMHLIHRDK